MKWKEVSKLIQVYKDYVNGNLNYEDAQRALHSELKFNKMKLSLDATLDERDRHISLILPDNKKILLKVWINTRIRQKILDMEITIKHLSSVLEDRQVIQSVNNILKKLLEAPK